MIKMTIDNQAVAGDISKTNFLWGLDVSRDSINYELRDEIIAAERERERDIEREKETHKRGRGREKERETQCVLP
jgi:hypothetical protein